MTTTTTSAATATYKISASYRQDPAFVHLRADAERFRLLAEEDTRIYCWHNTHSDARGSGIVVCVERCGRSTAAFAPTHHAALSIAVDRAREAQERQARGSE